jgi:hypothetical protein
MLVQSMSRIRLRPAPARRSCREWNHRECRLRHAGGTFAQHRRPHTFLGGSAAMWVVPWSLPLSDVLEDGAALDMPVVHGGDPPGIEHASAAAAGECGECHRRIGRTERGGAEILGPGAQQLGASTWRCSRRSSSATKRPLQTSPLPTSPDSKGRFARCCDGIRIR